MSARSVAHRTFLAPPHYSAGHALRESASLASTACVVLFCEAVNRFVEGVGDEHSVRRLAAVVAFEARRRGLLAERMLSAFRIAGCGTPSEGPGTVDKVTASLRYLRTTRACLREYFGTAREN